MGKQEALQACSEDADLGSGVVTGHLGSPKGTQAVTEAEVTSVLKQRMGSEMEQPQLPALQLV